MDRSVTRGHEQRGKTATLECIDRGIAVCPTAQWMKEANRLYDGGVLRDRGRVVHINTPARLVPHHYSDGTMIANCTVRRCTDFTPRVADELTTRPP